MPWKSSCLHHGVRSWPKWGWETTFCLGTLFLQFVSVEVIAYSWREACVTLHDYKLQVDQNNKRLCAAKIHSCGHVRCNTLFGARGQGLSLFDSRHKGFWYVSKLVWIHPRHLCSGLLLCVGNGFPTGTPPSWHPLPLRFFQMHGWIAYASLVHSTLLLPSSSVF